VVEALGEVESHLGAQALVEAVAVVVSAFISSLPPISCHLIPPAGNRSMADVNAIKALLSKPEMSDQHVMAALRPAAASDRNLAMTNPRSPPPAEWRRRAPIGVLLDHRTYSLKANHFRVNTSRIPGRVYQYHVHIRQYDRAGALRPEDISHTEDFRINVELVMTLQARHPEWPIGFLYDSRSTVFTTVALSLSEVNAAGEPFSVEDVAILNLDGTESRRRYQVSVTYATSCISTGEWFREQDPALLRALDLSPLEFARRQMTEAAPRWYLSGNIGYSSSGETLKLGPGVVAMRGHFVGFKTCLAGLVLVSDMCSSVFLSGGPLLNVIAELCGSSDANAWASRAGSQPMRAEDISRINVTLKNTKLKLLHLGYAKKFKSLGPAANHRDSTFEKDNRRMTVAEYFQEMGRTTPLYRQHLRNGRLQYPGLPTVNVGSVSKPVLIPMELVVVCHGQNFSQKCTGEMTASLIRHAAVLPNERFHNLLGSMQSPDSLLTTIRTDAIAAAFGVSDFEVEPMCVSGRLLPPPKLSYLNQQVEPKLGGSWNLPRPVKFSQNPPAPSSDGSFKFRVVVVGRPRPGWEQVVDSFLREFQTEAKACSLNFVNGGSVLRSSERHDELTGHFQSMMAHGARFVLVVLCGDQYCDVKFAADPLGLTTCCLRWKTVENPSRGKLPNILVKLNSKLGGINHSVSLTKNSIAPFDRLCMLVGIDVSHAVPGSGRPSVAAVVGSLDRQVCSRP
jgi:hypothetical protein